VSARTFFLIFGAYFALRQAIEPRFTSDERFVDKVVAPVRCIFGCEIGRKTALHRSPLDRAQSAVHATTDVAERHSWCNWCTKIWRNQVAT
jgi:hypothetical protein